MPEVAQGVAAIAHQMREALAANVPGCGPYDVALVCGLDERAYRGLLQSISFLYRWPEHPAWRIRRTSGDRGVLEGGYVNCRAEDLPEHIEVAGVRFRIDPALEAP